MSYMVKLINMACEAAMDSRYPGLTGDKKQRRDDAPHVTSLIAEVGELTGVLPEYLIKYFPEAAKGTLCEGADFKVISVSAEASCNACGTSYHPSRENDYRCPDCGSTDAHFLRGREIRIKSVTIH